jgi:hypothetical protein
MPRKPARWRDCSVAAADLPQGNGLQPNRDATARVRTEAAGASCATKRKGGTAMLTDAEIESLVNRFVEGTLPRSEWTHQAHLTVALWALRRLGREQAVSFLRGAIQRYNLRHDNPAGYHETITRAWVAVIARFLADRDPSQPLCDQAAALAAAYGSSADLNRHYSLERLRSDEARHAWVEPDLLPIEA